MSGGHKAGLQDQPLPRGPDLAWNPLRLQLLDNIKLNYQDSFSSTVY
jgi:hypothetical protein